MNCVKEIQSLIDRGMPVRKIKLLYRVIADEFSDWCDHPEVTQFQANIASLSKTDRKGYHYSIDEACNQAGVDLSWREVKVKPSRFKHCAVCGKAFYDLARNGKTLTCDRLGEYRRWDFTNREYYYYIKNGKRLSECGAEYELRRYDKVKSVARSNEILTDFQPDPNDAYSINLMAEIELASEKLR